MQRVVSITFETGSLQCTGWLKCPQTVAQNSALLAQSICNTQYWLLLHVTLKDWDKYQNGIVAFTKGYLELDVEDVHVIAFEDHLPTPEPVNYDDVPF